MNNEDFKVIFNTRKMIFLIDKYLVNVPNREKALTDRIKNTSYDILEYIYLANNLDKIKFKDKRIYYEYKAVSKINVLDFLIEEIYHKRYISEKNFKEIINYILGVNKLMRGWIKFEESNN